jgi:hypothetical protein
MYARHYITWMHKDAEGVRFVLKMIISKKYLHIFTFYENKNFIVHFCYLLVSTLRNVFRFHHEI